MNTTNTYDNHALLMSPSQINIWAVPIFTAYVVIAVPVINIYCALRHRKLTFIGNEAPGAGFMSRLLRCVTIVRLQSIIP